MKKVVFLLLLCVTLSCTEDKFQNDTEVVADKISRMASDEGVSVVSVYMYQDHGVYLQVIANEGDFEVSNGMLRVKRSWYNLSRVIRMVKDEYTKDEKFQWRLNLYLN
ncbi:hypothetical protein OAT16_11155 [Prolixibacteraceae bacterium]|nr:hypothetical protein [Prolixibacteraceae bacterium]